MASQPSVTSVVQKRGARLPKEKSDVGETPFPGSLSLREIDAAPHKGPRTGLGHLCLRLVSRQKYIQEGLDQSCCRLGFRKLCRLDPLALDPALSWMKPTPGSHASILLHTSPNSRFTRSPHRPGKSPSSAMGPLSLEKRMTRGVARGRHGTSGTRSGVPSGESLFQLPQVGRFQTEGVKGMESSSTLRRVVDPLLSQLEAKAGGFVSANLPPQCREKQQITDANVDLNLGDAEQFYFGGRLTDFEATRIYSPPAVNT